MDQFINYGISNLVPRSLLEIIYKKYNYFKDSQLNIFISYKII